MFYNPILKNDPISLNPLQIENSQDIVGDVRNASEKLAGGQILGKVESILGEVESEPE